jgi:hypothetical protein
LKLAKSLHYVWKARELRQAMGTDRHQPAAEPSHGRSVPSEVFLAALSEEFDKILIEILDIVGGAHRRCLYSEQRQATLSERSPAKDERLNAAGADGRTSRGHTANTRIDAPGPREAGAWIADGCVASETESLLRSVKAACTERQEKSKRNELPQCRTATSSGE